jgi:phage replication initiation protein
MESKTSIDWLGYRHRGELNESILCLNHIYGNCIKFERNDYGKFGFKNSADVFAGGDFLGQIYWGGSNQRGWSHVSLTGLACSRVGDWKVAQGVLESLDQFELRRVDIALDTKHREVSHEKVLKAYKAGGFTTTGRTPKLSQILPGEPLDGRTIYVGSRSQAKYVRGYEKGLELLKNFDSSTLDKANIVLDGVKAVDWYRLEAELKAKGESLPLDVVCNRDHYFSGLYPYFSEVLESDPASFKLSPVLSPVLSLAGRLTQIRKQYGTSLYTAIAAYSGDISAVWGKIVGDRHNDDLVRSGVLAVDHYEAEHLLRTLRSDVGASMH